jgi:outer membrane protein assembly factor BamA
LICFLFCHAGFAQKNLYQMNLIKAQNDSMMLNDSLRLQSDSLKLLSDTAKVHSDSLKVKKELVKKNLIPLKVIPMKVVLIDTPHLPDFRRIQKEVFLKKDLYDTLQCKMELQQQLFRLNSYGYLAASFDSISFDSLSCKAFLFLGGRYEWASLDAGNVDEEFLNKTGFRSKLYNHQPIRYDQVRQLEERILANAEDEGYPFAAVRLDSITITDGSIAARLHLDKNDLIHIDSIEIKGKANINPVYIYNYISIKPGSVYNESLIKQISSRIRELAFLRESQPARVLFSKTSTRLQLFLEDKKASQFDGIVGVLPSQTDPGAVNITGEAHLKLQNSLSGGEVIELNWRKLIGNTQDFTAHGLYPFILSSPFGLEGDLYIYKQDTTYLEVKETLGLQYLLLGGNYLKIFIAKDSYSLLSTVGLDSTTVLPQYADVSTTSYGLGLKKEHLDYHFNPRRGYSFEITGSVGTRQITQNPKVNPAAYDSVKLNTTQYQASLVFDNYFPIASRSVIDVGTQSAYEYSPSLFTDELYRIGGLKSLRGFDEQSILASAYSIWKIEYRYLTEQNSNLFAFVNGAWYEDRSNDIHTPPDWPFGFGVGMSFETKLGIFSVSYALGESKYAPLDFRDAKIHFGIINYF